MNLDTVNLPPYAPTEPQPTIELEIEKVLKIKLKCNDFLELCQKHLYWDSYILKIFFFVMWFKIF
jgi:hypothetical protein